MSVVLHQSSDWLGNMHELAIDFMGTFTSDNIVCRARVAKVFTIVMHYLCKEL